MECVTKKLVFDCFLDAGFYKSVFESSVEKNNEMNKKEKKNMN